VPPRNAAERRAARWYRLRAYRMLGTNVWIAGYELDLIATRGRTVVFCEVKSKSTQGFGDPLEMVSAEKVRRIRRAAEVWLAVHPVYRSYALRFDVVAVRGARLECLRSAF
jgi:putative endonuclease